ncbi:unnamed protein product [Caenorhabditis angaria]|uniref:Uncharacterized protein n=1 Tax=Caenorhabditis angaria TaxID=860376 RepID=A0A9P1J3U8_9PELO|nr:unnamed protein product [Caenorhabditis angaria]
MNAIAIILALACLFASTLAQNRYGWPSSYERYLERQGVWDYNRHEAKANYRNRKSYERDLRDLYEDWKRQTRWGKPDYRSNRFGQPTGGLSRYGFQG